MRFFSVITCRNVFNEWPKATTLLRLWCRDAERLDTSTLLFFKDKIIMFVFLYLCTGVCIYIFKMYILKVHTYLKLLSDSLALAQKQSFRSPLLGMHGSYSS